jgi:hypothetical protein
VPAISDSVKIIDILSDSGYKKKSHFIATMEYQSNDVYLGRQDSTKLPYLIPSFGYYDKSGVFANASLNYLNTGDISRIDLVTIEAGYMFTTGNYEGTFTASKYFYNSQSTSVTSEIKASLEYYNAYDFGFIRTTFTGTLNFGNKTDFAGELGIEHTFYMFEDDLDITPTITAGASTQNYYSDYYKNRRYTIKRNGKTQTGIAAITGTVFNAGEFKMLAYEGSLPINYSIGKWTISFTPFYSIPVNPAEIDVHTVRSNGQVFDKTKAEKIGNIFWWTAGVSIIF